MPSPVTWSDDERRRFVDDGVLIRRGLVHGVVLSKALALVGGWLAGWPRRTTPRGSPPTPNAASPPSWRSTPTSSPCTGEAACRSWPETCCGPLARPGHPGADPDPASARRAAAREADARRRCLLPPPGTARPTHVHLHRRRRPGRQRHRGRRRSVLRARRALPDGRLLRHGLGPGAAGPDSRRDIGQLRQAVAEALGAAAPLGIP